MAATAVAIRGSADGVSSKCRARSMPKPVMSRMNRSRSSMSSGTGARALM